MTEVAIVPTELEAAKMAVKALKFERDSLKRERDAMRVVVDAAREAQDRLRETHYHLIKHGSSTIPETLLYIVEVLREALAAYDKETAAPSPEETDGENHP